MRASLEPFIQCPNCRHSQFENALTDLQYSEFRGGYLACASCKKKYTLKDGIADFLADPTPEILKESEGAHAEIRIHTKEGEKFRVDKESIQRFKNLFLSMPYGDDSYFFKEGGSFQNFSESAHRFYTLVDRWKIGPGQRVLEIGAGFCWASRELAKKGCDLVSIDICNYLEIADLYIRDNLFFERFYADMDVLPFKDGTFDIIFAAAAIHHSSDLEKTFKEFKRVLKPGGRLIMINECFIGLLEKPPANPEDFAFNDHYFSVPHWETCLKKTGFKYKTTYLSFLKDYVERKKTRRFKNNFKLSCAKFVVACPPLDNFISWVTIPLRVLTKPRSVMIEATKPGA